MSLAPEYDTGAALDAYSRIVTAVAADLTPHVAALQVMAADGRGGAGSAVVVPGDNLLLTNAHVVGRARGGRAVFSDGSESDVDVVGADPLSDLAVVRARTAAPPPAELGNAAAQQVGQLVVARAHAGTRVDDQQHHGGVRQRRPRLLLDRAGQLITVLKVHAPGVDKREGAPVPLRGQLVSIAGDAGAFVHHSLSGASQSIDQR